MIYYGLEQESLDSYFQMKEVTAPGTPQANEIRLYAKDSSGTSTLCYKNDAGTEICFPTSGSFVTGTGVSGRVAFWNGTNTLSSDADLTFVTDTLTATKIIAPTSVTISALTAGSVVFAGPAGLLSQDNANIFWDSTTHRLGLGNSAPDFCLAINGATNAQANIVIREASADTTSPGLALLKARGTLGSEAATNSGDNLGNVSFGGWTNAYKFNAARINADAGSLWTATNSESIMYFQTTPSGSVTRATRFQIGSAGQWGIGGATYGSSGDIFSSGGASAAPSWVTRATLNAALDHGLLAGLADDDHTQYALLAGRSGGQVLKGGTASGDDLTLWSTNNATKGQIFIGSSGSSFKHEATQKWVFQETIANAGAGEVGFHILPTLNGAGDFGQGARFTPTFAPSASISATYGFIGVNYSGPPTTVTITQANAAYAASGYLDVAGAVTTGVACRLAAPEIFGALKPGTQYGLFVENQGAASITNAIGVHVAAQSGATNNYDMSFGRVDTTAAGAYYGRIPVLYNGLTKYIHVFSA